MMEKSSAVGSLQHEPWFHGKVSRQDAESYLRDDGDFLVRESSTTPGQFVLSGLHDGLRKHLLLVDPYGVVSFSRLWNFDSNIPEDLFEIRFLS